MTKRNLFIIGGVAAFLALAIGYWFTAPYWTAMRTKSEAQNMITASLPRQAGIAFRNLKSDGLWVCGEISGNVGVGARSGFERFIWLKTTGVEFKPVVQEGMPPEIQASQTTDVQDWEDRYKRCTAEGM